MSAPAAHRSAERGMLLIEALVAMLIVATVTVTFIGIRSNSLIDATRARNWRLAREIAEEKLSVLQAGAHEVPPESGMLLQVDKYDGFSFKIVLGETAVANAEGEVANEAAGDDNETRRRRFLTLSADESVWRTGEVEFSAIEGVVARDVSFDGSRSRTTLRETAKAIARGGRCEDSETRELFDRRVCFGEEVVKRLEKSDVDASARVKGFVERELKCFEEGVEAFASERGGDEPKFAYVALEGATYASKKFGSKSDIALWSAKETKAAVARVMASMAKKDGFEFGALALASRDPERSTRGSERKLLGIDHRRSLLANSTSSDENDDAVVARFMRKGVAWAVAIIFIGAAVAGVLAIMGMPLQKEPFLYTAIPGVKLD